MIKIARAHADEIIAHARQEDPDECCGILAGRDSAAAKLYRITNTVKSPYRYMMDPQEFLDADLDSERNGMEFVAFYHSHTHSPAYPSQTDVRMAQQSGYHDVPLHPGLPRGPRQPPDQRLPNPRVRRDRQNSPSKSPSRPSRNPLSLDGRGLG